MSMSKRLGWLGMLVILVLGAAAPALAGGDKLRATLDGKPISLDVAATLSCSDVDYPILTCYRTSGELEVAMAAATSDDLTLSTGLAATTSTGYVIVFEHGQYAGASMALSQNYTYLGTIGWNDKISSFKSYGASGKFWENAPSGGFIYYFGPTTWVAYVGDVYNDRFSAFYLN